MHNYPTDLKYAFYNFKMSAEQMNSGKLLQEEGQDMRRHDGLKLMFESVTVAYSMSSRLQ